MTLKEAGFKVIMGATGAGMRLALATRTTGEIVLIAHTPKGEGYTPYPTHHEALHAFNTIVTGANLIRL